MKGIVVYKFRVFDEIIKQKVMAVVQVFPGVTSVIEVEGEGKLEVRGEFDNYEMTKELKKIDESVDIIKVGPDEEKDLEVNKPPNAETLFKTTFDKEKVNNPSGAAGSSNWTFGFWDKAKDISASAAKHTLVLGAVVFEQAKVIGAGAVEVIRKRKAEEKKAEEKKESDRRYMENYKKREEARKKEEDELRQKREKKKKEEAQKREEARKKEEDERQKEARKKEETRKKEAARKKERETTQVPTQTQGLTGKFMTSFNSFTTGGTSGSTRDPRWPRTYNPDFFNPSNDHPP